MINNEADLHSVTVWMTLLSVGCSESRFSVLPVLPSGASEEEPGRLLCLILILSLEGTAASLKEDQASAATETQQTLSSVASA